MDEMLNELQNTMGRTGRITTSEQRMVMAATVQNYRNTEEIKTMLNRLEIKVSSNPMIAYGNWLREKPFVVISTTLALLSVFIMVMNQIEANQAWGVIAFLVERIK